MSFLSTIWDTIWWFFTVFVFIAYLMALFSIIGDLFRDKNLKGIYKAIWMLFLVFLPFVTAVVYLIVRGRGMGHRAERQVSEAQTATDEYIRAVSGGAAGQIAQAKQLLDDGAITPDEYQRLKDSVLSEKV